MKHREFQLFAEQQTRASRLHVARKDAALRSKMASATAASLVSKLNPDVEAYRKFLDLVLADICKQGGAVYVGIQPQLVPQIPALVLFHSPKHRSTVGIPLHSVTPMAVAARVQMSDGLFEASSRPAPALAPVQPTLKLAWLPKTPPRSRFRLAKRIHKMISRDGREWNSVIENFRQIRSGR